MARTTKPKTKTVTKQLSPISRITAIDKEIAKKQDEIKKLKTERRALEKKIASAEIIELQEFLKKKHKTVADVKKAFK